MLTLCLNKLMQEILVFVTPQATEYKCHFGLEAAQGIIHKTFSLADKGIHLVLAGLPLQKIHVL